MTVDDHQQFGVVSVYPMSLHNRYSKWRLIAIYSKQNAGLNRSITHYEGLHVFVV